MIEVMVLETHGTKEQHCKLLQSAMDEGFDITSNHVNVSYPDNDVYTERDVVMVYTTYLQRGSRPGQANKASQIEILENEIKALKAIAEANSLAIKAVDSRLDATIRDFHGGDDEEVVPNNWLEDYMANLRALNTKPQIIPVDSIRIHGVDYSYEDVISEALREDEELGR